VIRINPEDVAGPPNAVVLAGTALTVLREIDARIAGSRSIGQRVVRIEWRGK